MTRGRINIVGNAGMHLGAYMKGGDDRGVRKRLGLGRRRDVRRTHPDRAATPAARVGAAYRGSLRGMTNGTIIVGGSAGLEIGMRMKRGLIVIGGPVRDFAGLEMKGGTIVLRSGAELRTGAWMSRGTIISLKPIPLLPSFLYASSLHPRSWACTAKHLASLGIALPLRRAATVPISASWATRL